MNRRQKKKRAKLQMVMNEFGLSWCDYRFARIVKRMKKEVKTLSARYPGKSELEIWFMINQMKH